MFQTVENIIHLIDKDDMSKYLLFLEDVFPYIEKYHYQKGMKEIIRELKQLLKGNNHGTSSDRALLLDYQATMETKHLRKSKKPQTVMPTLFPTFMPILEVFIA